MYFDPYHKWLGIAPQDQPPTYYRLLAISLFEADLEVIDAAANRQMDYLLRHAYGEHAVLAQRLRAEISLARMCLFDATRKLQYDNELRHRLGVLPTLPPAGPETAAQVAAAPLAIEAPADSSLAKSFTQRRRSGPSVLSTVLGVPIGGVMGIYAGALILRALGIPLPEVAAKLPGFAPPAVQEAPPAVAPAPVPMPVEPGPRTVAPPAVSPGPTVVPPPSKQLRPEPAPSVAPQGAGVSPNLPAKPVAPLPVPADAALASAELEVRSTLGEPAVAVCLSAAKTASRDAPARAYVLWRRAKLLATAAGDVSAAWEAHQALAEHFEVDEFAARAVLLTDLSESVQAPDQRRLAELCGAAVDEAIERRMLATGARLAPLFLKAARKSGDVALAAAATQRLLAIQKAASAGADPSSSKVP